MTHNTPDYSNGDTSYQTAGGLDGITRLANRFYDLMDTLPEAKNLRDMHPDDLGNARKKLIWFLSGWFGGPALYAEKVGTISLAMSHAHLPVDMDSKNAWLNCMKQAMAEQGYPQAFCEYWNGKFANPAEAMRLMAEFRNSPPVNSGQFKAV
jgi:hemoglobin